MCSIQLNFTSIIIPRYLAEYSLVIEALSMTKLMFTYINILLIQFLCLNETCRMIGYLISKIVNLVEIRFEWL